MGRVAPVGGAKGMARIAARISPGRIGPFISEASERGKGSVLSAGRWMLGSGQRSVGAALGAADQRSASRQWQRPIGQPPRKR